MRDGRIGPVTDKESGDAGELVAVVKAEESGGLFDVDWGVVLFDRKMRPDVVRLSSLTVLNANQGATEQEKRDRITARIAQLNEELAEIGSAAARRRARRAGEPEPEPEPSTPSLPPGA